MADVTCAEFGRILAGAAGTMEAEWARARGANAEAFPERLEPSEWWVHFSNVVMPEVLMALGSTGREADGAARPAHAAADA